MAAELAAWTHHDLGSPHLPNFCWKPTSIERINDNFDNPRRIQSR